MPTLQQVGETLPRPDTSRLDYHRLMDGSVNENFSRSSDSESLMSIAELLGLNMPRGSLVGGGGGLGSYGQGETAAAPANPLVTGSSSRPYSGDDSGYQTSHPGSPLPVDMSTQGKSSMARRGRLDSVGAFPPASPAPSQSSLGPFSPGSGPSTRPFRAGSHTLSESGSSIGQGFMMNSRATSPESNSSLNSLDNSNFSDLMSCLYLHARNRSDSGLSAGFPSNDEHSQQGLTNLANLHVLQTLTNNPSLNFYQHNQQLQSPLSSPVSSPVAGPDKSWSPGSRSNSLSSSVPGSPLCMSSPLRGLPTPKTPPSPGASVNRYHRSPVSSEADATCTWSGKLPPRSIDNASISVKVFIGGVPWDINDAMLVHAFRHFGSIRVEWPTSKQPGVPPPKGYAYIIFECEKQVKALLQACSYSFSDGEGHWFYKVSSKRMKAKVVQVIPWTSSDTNWVLSPSQKLDPEKTVFVGGLHGMLNAHGLAQIMDDLFDGVVYAGIDTDKFKYPIGSARVTFMNNRSFFKAINSRFIEIKTEKFAKKVQLDPYLEDAPCSICSVQHGPYFCRELSCFRYYCRSCWHWRHSQDNSLVPHKYLMRSSKSHGAITDGMGLTMNFSLGLRGQNRRELAYL